MFWRWREETAAGGARRGREKRKCQNESLPQASSTSDSHSQNTASQKKKERRRKKLTLHMSKREGRVPTWIDSARDWHDGCLMNREFRSRERRGRRCEEGGVAGQVRMSKGSELGGVRASCDPDRRLAGQTSTSHSSPSINCHGQQHPHKTTTTTTRT